MGIIQKIKDNYRTITLFTLLLPILVSVIVSLAHVVAFWDITNPLSWAIFLSIGIEVAVLSSIAASRISNAVWFPFIIVTFIQIIGNIFYSYSNVNVDGKLFLDWVELTDPIFVWFGSAANDIILHKRVVAIGSGSWIPLIAITFFSFFIKMVRVKDETVTTPPITPPKNYLTEEEVNEMREKVRDIKLPEQSSDYIKIPDIPNETPTIIGEENIDVQEVLKEAVKSDVPSYGVDAQEVLREAAKSDNTPVVEKKTEITPEETEITPAVEEIKPDKIEEVPIIEKVEEVPIIEKVEEVPEITSPYKKKPYWLLNQ